MTHRFSLDNDGTNFFAHIMTDDVEDSIAAAVALCPAQVTTYFLCPNASGKFYYPTRIGEVDPATQRLAALHKQGKDPFGLFLAALRQAGKETFITYRMNDVHGADDPNHLGTAEFKKQHPDFIVDPAAAADGLDGWMPYCLDYSRPEVRNYILSTIRELVDLYEIDGFQLDWMRFPRHLSGNPDEVWKKRDDLTEFTASVGEILRQKDPQIQLSARVPTSPAGCRHVGIDLEAWCREELVDFVVAAPFLTTDFHMPIQELRQHMGDRPVPVYADIEFGHSSQIHCPESLRAAALGLFAAGADGLYIFNFPCWTEYIGAPPYHWLENLDTPERASGSPLLFSVSHQLDRIPAVDLPGQLPAILPIGGGLEIHLHIPETALPARRLLILVDSGSDFTLKINNGEALELPALRRAELFAEYIPQEDQGDSQRSFNTECRLFQAAPSYLRGGLNTLSMYNTATHDLNITRINLGIW